VSRSRDWNEDYRGVGEQPWVVQLLVRYEDDSTREIGYFQGYDFVGVRFSGELAAWSDDLDADTALVGATLASSRRWGLPPKLFEPLMPEAESVFVIQRVGIHPAWRGQGFGRAIVREALSMIRGERTVLVATFPGPYERLDSVREWQRVRRFWSKHLKYVHIGDGVVVAPYLGRGDMHPRARAALAREWRTGIEVPWAPPVAHRRCTNRMCS
jgi:GNAT superfamily N-acetyltransferase